MKAINSMKAIAQDSIEELKSFDWNDLGDIQAIGVWPGVVKLILGIAVFSACLGGGYWFHIKNLQVSLAGVVAKEGELKLSLESKAVLAANLEIYQQQMRDMEESFGSLLSRLPDKTEVPGLIEDITFTGLGSGLKFTSIELQNELARAFYIELPIKIEVSGNYHDFGTFVSGVASLPRIVTLHDFTITTGASRGELDMTINASTYRYKADG